MSGTDIVLHELAVTGPLGEPTGLVFPDGSGEVASLDDPEAVARWYRVVRDLEDEALKPAKSVAAAALYQHMDAEGVWTLHFASLDVSGESRAAWETATKVDAEGLYEDRVTLKQREGIAAEAAEDWADDFFRIEMKLTDAGRQRLSKMASAYRDALAEHTTPHERARKAPSVRRTK
jgi:hypothetical protein